MVVVISKDKMFRGRKSVYLTEDLVMNILLRLPVIAQMRFKCVCKSWYSLINSSSFMAAKQLLLDRDAPPYIVITGRNLSLSPVCGTRILSYDTLGDHGVFDYRNFSPAYPRGHHLGHDNRWIKIYCLFCCDGVLFVKYPIAKVLRYKYALWNPVTGDTMAIPIDRNRYDRFLENYGVVDKHGCGFDSKNNEYRPFLVRSDRRLYSMQIEIYSFINNKWKLIEYPGIISHGCSNLEMVYANGICHWVGFSSVLDRDVVISFDTSNEVILTTPFPDDIIYTYSHDYYEPRYCPYPLLFNESLALVKRWNIDDDNRLAVAGTSSFDIWVLGEYGNKDSWTKLFTIGPLPGIEQVVGFWNETEIFVTDGDCQLFLYDTVTPQALNLQMRLPVTTAKVFICKQSLCPIVDQDQVLNLNKKWQLRLGSKRKKMKTKWSDGNHKWRQRLKE